MNVVAVVAAAGKGKRLKLPYNKVFHSLNGAPLLFYTLQTLEECKEVSSVYLMVSADDFGNIKYSGIKKFKKIKKICEGGEERQDTVRIALSNIKEADIILIHDGARPLIEKNDIERCIRAAERYDAAVLGVPVKDTVKIADSKMNVVSTPNRKNLWQIQTPQCFKFNVIKKAYEVAEKNGIRAADDSALVEFTGVKVKIVKGSYMNIKITTAEDVLTAEAFLSCRGKKCV